MLNVFAQYLFVSDFYISISISNCVIYSLAAGVQHNA